MAIFQGEENSAMLHHILCHPQPLHWPLDLGKWKKLFQFLSMGWSMQIIILCMGKSNQYFKRICHVTFIMELCLIMFFFHMLDIKN